MLTHMNLSPPAVKASSLKTQAEVFDACVASKNRLLILLSGAFFAYYFTLVIGAGWFRSLFASPLFGQVNVGIVFTLSQYLFGAALALLYAKRMKAIDARIATVAQSYNPGDEA